MKTKEQKTAYVQKKISQGFKSYYGLNESDIETLDLERLEVEYDYAVNWSEQ